MVVGTRKSRNPGPLGTVHLLMAAVARPGERDGPQYPVSELSPTGTVAGWLGSAVTAAFMGHLLWMWGSH